MRATRDAVRTGTEAVRETVRTEAGAVREAARAETPGAVRAALGPVYTALGADLRELQERHELAAAGLADGLRAAQDAVRTEGEAVRETLRTETGAVRDAVRETAPAEDRPPVVDRAAVVAELADQIRDAVNSGERWTPDYGELMARTGYGRSWSEKAVRDARTLAFAELGTSPDRDDGTAAVPGPSSADPEEA